MTGSDFRNDNILPAGRAMPLMEHIQELRRRLLFCLIAFVISFAVCYYFSKPIYRFLAEPLLEIMRQKGEQPHLIYTALYEAFFTYVRVGFFGAIFLSFPIVAVQIWIFVAPGLYYHEKKLLAPFLIATPLLFVMGAMLAYYFVFPFAWKFFMSFQSLDTSGNLRIQLEARVSEYLALVMKLILAFGMSFELPVFLSLLVRMKIITLAHLKTFRRYAYVMAFIIAAILTPPDVFTQSFLAIALIILYEISVVTARVMSSSQPVAN